MFTFTFDNIYFFERKSYNDYWFVFTNPMFDSDMHFQGYFSIENGEYIEGGSINDHVFSGKDKQEITSIIITHKKEMDLSQFDVYLKQPAHYVEIYKHSSKYQEIKDSLCYYSRTEPALSLALDKLQLEDPAYRLNRNFIRKLIEESKNITSQEIEEFLYECAEDTWSADIAPYSDVSFEEFYKDYIREFYTISPIEEKKYSNVKIFEIENIPEIFYLECTTIGQYKIIEKRHFFRSANGLIYPTTLPDKYYIQ